VDRFGGWTCRRDEYRNIALGGSNDLAVPLKDLLSFELPILSGDRAFLSGLSDPAKRVNDV